MTRAEWILSLCRMFHKLPSEILDEPVELLSLLAVEQLAHPEGVGSDG